MRAFQDDLFSYIQ